MLMLVTQQGKGRRHIINHMQTLLLIVVTEGLTTSWCRHEHLNPHLPSTSTSPKMAGGLNNDLTRRPRLSKCFPK